MTPEEFLKLDWIGRFKQTIQTIKDNKTIWVLKNPDGTFPISCGRPKKFCVWGEESHAQYNRADGWEDTIPTAIPFGEFMTEVCPLLKKGRVNTILVSAMNNRRGKENPLADFLEKVGISITDAIDKQVKRGQYDKIVPETPDNKLLEDRLDYLDENLPTKGCNNDLSMTISFLKEHSVKNIDNVIAWLQSKGGYCDCEVLANVEE